LVDCFQLPSFPASQPPSLKSNKMNAFFITSVVLVTTLFAPICVYMTGFPNPIAIFHGKSIPDKTVITITRRGDCAEKYTGHIIDCRYYMDNDKMDNDITYYICRMEANDGSRIDFDCSINQYGYDGKKGEFVVKLV
jgi:hypothetical protein